MKIFLNFFFTDKFEALKPEIIKHYDSEFVEKEIFSTIKDKYHKISTIIV